jgi:hypothetical protein
MLNSRLENGVICHVAGRGQFGTGTLRLRLPTILSFRQLSAIASELSLFVINLNTGVGPCREVPNLIHRMRPVKYS